jgi:hypothetical protein
VFHFQVSVLVKMTNSFAENFTDSMTFVVMLQIYVSLKTHFPLKSVVLQKNYN